MAIQIKAPRLRSEESPREILKADFRSIPELPIHGGWGYTQQDAVVIDRHDPVVPPGQPFDGLGWEYLFVEKRIHEELIVFQPDEDRCSGIRWELARQELIEDGGRWYDRLEFNVTAVPDREWQRLKDEWEGPNGFRSPGFDPLAHEADRERHTLAYTAVYWFDITSFAPGRS